MKVESFFDQATYTLTYIVFDEVSKDAIMIDPVLNYDQNSSSISFESIEQVEQFIKKNQLELRYILETHAHADHVSGAFELKKIFKKVKTAIGQDIIKVQHRFKEIFNLQHFPTDGSQFDCLLEEGKFSAGTIEVEVIHTPGHTPACCSFVIGDMIFTGDVLFMPDFGTGRCDFPDGSAANLYESVSKLYLLTDNTRTFTGHDYQPGGRELLFESTIGEHKLNNIHLSHKTTKEEYISFRTKRDSKLKVPKLLLPSIQININGGELPEPEANGTSYLKIPVNIKK